MQATAIAHPNIAFVKYWGKRNIDRNVPAAGSVSMTLDGLETRTSVEFSEALAADSLQLDGEPVGSGETLQRVESFLDLVRRRAGIERAAQVETRNNFPTAGGLASSASGFAALARAATEAAGVDLNERELSALARRGSGSAARSVFGGFVRMEVGEEGEGAAGFQIAEADYWDLRCLIAETAEGPKRVGSTEGMLHTERTSPYYDAWIDSVGPDVDDAVSAIRDRNFGALAEVAERSCLRMHAAAMGSDPGLLYWNGTTVELIHRVRAAREGGVDAFFSIDAGPHVKIFCEPSDEADTVSLVEGVDGVNDVRVVGPGDGARLVE